jgi:hypothetical protein
MCECVRASSNNAHQNTNHGPLARSERREVETVFTKGPVDADSGEAPLPHHGTIINHGLVEGSVFGAYACGPREHMKGRLWP